MCHHVRNIKIGSLVIKCQIIKMFQIFQAFFFSFNILVLNLYNLLQTTQPWPLSFSNPLAPLWYKSFIAILTFSPIDQTLIHDPPIKHTWHFVLFGKISNIDHFLCMGLDVPLNKALLLAFISSCNWLTCVQLFSFVSWHFLFMFFSLKVVTNTISFSFECFIQFILHLLALVNMAINQLKFYHNFQQFCPTSYVALCFEILM